MKPSRKRVFPRVMAGIAGHDRKVQMHLREDGLLHG
jgi:hypothetical protein